MTSLIDRKELIETIQGIITIIAILLGGIWAYFKIVKGRSYRARLEPKIEGNIVSNDRFQCAVIKMTLKNVGLTRVKIDKEQSTIEVLTYPEKNYIPEFHNAFLENQGVIYAITMHDWIEPGECVTEERLLALPLEKTVAVVLKLRLIEVIPPLRIRRGGVVWCSMAVLT